MPVYDVEFSDDWIHRQLGDEALRRAPLTEEQRAQYKPVIRTSIVVSEGRLTAKVSISVGD